MERGLFDAMFIADKLAPYTTYKDNSDPAVKFAGQCPVHEPASVVERWVHGVDLANGGQFGDFPEPFLSSLLSDIVTAWRRKELGVGLVLEVSGRAPMAIQPDSVPTATVRGALPALVRWAAGRGAVGVSFEGPRPTPPHWL